MKLIDSRLKQLGINSPEDAALYLPIGYEDLSTVVQNFEPYLLPVGHFAVFEGVLKKPIKTSFRKGKPVTIVVLTDHAHDLVVSLFGDQKKLSEEYEVGRILHFYGMPVRQNGNAYLNKARLIPKSLVGSIRPVYPGKAKVVKSSTLDRLLPPLVEQGIPGAALLLRNIALEASGGIDISEKLCRRRNLIEVLRQLHSPESVSCLDEAEEIVARYSVLSAANDILKRTNTRNKSRGRIFKGRYVGYLAKSLPFELTQEQKKCVKKAIAGMGTGYQYSALLIGDVGSGKTATFLLIAASVLSEGGRVSILLPNGTIAAQVHEEYMEYFGKYFPALLVTNSTVKGDEANYPILIGTTAMLFRHVGNFDLCITDEQQKLSVEQREQLMGDNAHSIEVSATPIPRTIALATHGAVDTLTIRSCHVKKQISTAIYRKPDSQILFDMLMDSIKNGGKALVICPKRDGYEQGRARLVSAEEVAQKFEKHLPGLVRVAHSGLSEDENAAAIQDMKQGTAKLLVSTSLIEVGVTIKGLNFAVVYGADRFGLQTLHQARGRLGRYGEPSHFALYLPGDKEPSEATIQRLNILVEHLDGFEVSKADLELRGAGDLTLDGQKQHGATTGIIQNRMIDIDRLAAAIEFIRNQESQGQRFDKAS